MSGRGKTHHFLRTIQLFTHSTIQPFTLNQSATELRIPIKQFNKSTIQQTNPLTQSWPILPPSRGEAFAANRHAPKVPPLMRGDFRGVKSEATESHRITISQFNNSTIQPFALNQSAPNYTENHRITNSH